MNKVLLYLDHHQWARLPDYHVNAILNPITHTSYDEYRNSSKTYMGNEYKIGDVVGSPFVIINGWCTSVCITTDEQEEFLRMHKLKEGCPICVYERLSTWDNREGGRGCIRYSEYVEWCNKNGKEVVK